MADEWIVKEGRLQFVNCSSNLSNFKFHHVISKRFIILKIITNEYPNRNKAKCRMKHFFLFALICPD